MIHTLMALDKVKSACTIPTRPTFKAFFGLLRGQNAPKWTQNGLKMGSFHPFVHPKWSRMRFGKMRF